nr:immunoglobulin heavy chain junction region [Mus musculus]
CAEYDYDGAWFAYW